MKSLMGALLAVGVGFATQAQARVYDWSYSDPSGNSGSGTLDVTGASSPYTMDAITGTFDGLTITGITSPGTCCDSPSNNNRVYDPAPYLDLGGIGFHTNEGTAWNLYYTGGAYAELNNGGYASGSGGTFTITAVPEASTWVMMLAGFAGLGALAVGSRRRALAA